jgi:hypothetical protein
MAEPVSGDSCQRLLRSRKRKFESFSSSFSRHPIKRSQRRLKCNAGSYQPQNIAFQDRPKETDPHRIKQRQKQIDYGKNTIGYQRYCQLVPKNKRKRTDPHTPDVHMAVSKRAWDSIVRRWRRMLHLWDPPQTTTSCEENSPSTGTTHVTTTTTTSTSTESETIRTEDSSVRHETETQSASYSEIPIRLEDILEYQTLVALDSGKTDVSSKQPTRKSWAEIVDEEERQEEERRETEKQNCNNHPKGSNKAESIYEDYVDDF